MVQCNIFRSHRIHLRRNHLLHHWPAGATLLTAPLPVSNAVEFSCMTKYPYSGLCLRMEGGYNSLFDRYQVQVDMLCGFWGGAPKLVYRPSPDEHIMLALLQEARAEYVAQLERLKIAA